MIIALASILAVMAVSALFGYAMHDVIQTGIHGHSEATEDALEADHDRWEDDPEPTEPEHVCDTCKYNEFNEWYEPCLHCGKGYEKWEMA